MEKDPQTTRSSDNVILLGAGFSAEAGIPLMKSFIDCMWTLGRTGRFQDAQIPQRAQLVLIEALKVREELDGYHGRAAFDGWNIEDVLSILSFSSKNRMQGMTKAIAQVIELTCNIKHNGVLNEQKTSLGMYERFWRAIVSWANNRKLPIPPILTFNYDLVLERSLLHSLAGKFYKSSEKFEFDGIEVVYSGSTCPDVRLACKAAQWQSLDLTTQSGMILQDILDPSRVDPAKFLQLEILKLHGSVNFPKPRRTGPPKNTGAKSLITALEDPLILPPIFNKATDSVGRDVWGRALNILRNCKRLIICGYSLPTTDTYMQYFLKAALGPNLDLDHIYVFDPVLFDDDRHKEGEALRQRYSCNFSQPIQRRIDFQPHSNTTAYRGTAEHLTRVLEEIPQAILFG